MNIIKQHLFSLLIWDTMITIYYYRLFIKCRNVIAGLYRTKTDHRVSDTVGRYSVALVGTMDTTQMNKHVDSVHRSGTVLNL